MGAFGLAELSGERAVDTRERRAIFAENIRRLCSKGPIPSDLTATERKRLSDWQRDGLARPDRRTRPLLAKLARHWMLPRVELLWEPKPEAEAKSTLSRAFDEAVAEELATVRRQTGVGVPPVQDCWQEAVLLVVLDHLESVVTADDLHKFYGLGKSFCEAGWDHPFLRRAVPMTLEEHRQAINKEISSINEHWDTAIPPMHDTTLLELREIQHAITHQVAEHIRNLSALDHIERHATLDDLDKLTWLAEASKRVGTADHSLIRLLRGEQQSSAEEEGCQETFDDGLAALTAELDEEKDFFEDDDGETYVLDPNEI